jgi:muramoyltetrapeptide carboxypeptidase
MVLFGGGDSGAEILPYIDYENIRRHPKLFSSYSDGTTTLNAISAQTGLVTYYGASPSVFEDLRTYDWEQFQAHFVKEQNPAEFEKDSVWKTLHGGKCSGTLMGGYSYLFALILGSKYFKYDAAQKYLLFMKTTSISTPPAR